MEEDFNLKKKRNKISVKLRASSFARDHWTAHKKIGAGNTHYRYAFQY